MPELATFDLEFRLKLLKTKPWARVVAIYDCCRISLQGIKGLQGAIKQRADQDDYSDDEQEEHCKYLRITACGPGGIAEADADFAKHVFAHSLKWTQREPPGYVVFPKDFIHHDWMDGRVLADDGENYSLKFDPKKAGVNNEEYIEY